MLQVFQELHDGDANVLVCAPTGSGKTMCAELALMRLFTTNPTARAVYIAPKPEVRHTGSSLPLTSSSGSFTEDNRSDRSLIPTERSTVGLFREI